MGDTGLGNIAEITSLCSLALSEAMHVTARWLDDLSAELTGLTSLALGLAQDLGSGSIAQAVSSLALVEVPGGQCSPAGMMGIATCWPAADGARVCKG